MRADRPLLTRRQLRTARICVGIEAACILAAVFAGIVVKYTVFPAALPMAGALWGALWAGGRERRRQILGV